MHVMIEVLRKFIANKISPRLSSHKSRQHIYQSISGYIFSHSLVTLLDKTVSIWHRDGSATFISVFYFYDNEIFSP